jgi:aspartate 1-decarboxylase
MKSKIHKATVTEANLDYNGSITIDESLMEASGIVEYEEVDVLDITNGQRLTTYVIKGKRDSGMICLNGAAARLVHVGDKIIVVAYALIDAKDAEKHEPRVILLDDDNKILRN